MMNGSNKYNIIWVDDDVDQLQKDSERLLRKYGINIIDKAHTAQEFHDKIKYKLDLIDAIITDANFGDREADLIKNENTLRGLRELERNIEAIRKIREIPFFLYTGRFDLLDDKDEDEFRYFKETNRIFKKENGPTELFKRICQDIEHINSTEFLIRNRYQNELEAAKRIPGNEECLFNALKHDYSKEIEPENTALYFNVLRKIIERIFERSKERKIIAPIRSLNAWSKFLQNKDEYYEIIDSVEIMPKALVNSLKYLLEITQDGSHSTDTCVVDKYVRENGGINIFRSALHITMELCIWFDKYIQTHPNPFENANCWRIRPQKEDKDFFKYEGKIYIPEKDDDGIWHCDECWIKITHWESGKMKLREVGKNTVIETKHKYPYFARFDKIE